MKTFYVHQESDAYRVYSSGLYKDTVAIASTVQGNAQKIEAISRLVGGVTNVASQLEITTPTLDISNVPIVNGNGTLSTIPTLTLQGEFAVSVSGTLENTVVNITAMGIYGGSSSSDDDSKSTNNDEHMLGSNGTQVSSKTTWQNGKTERIDVENPAPGKRPGQIHYHDANNNKYYYDIDSNAFYDYKTRKLAPNNIQKLLHDNNFMKGIKKGLKILGE